MVGGHFNSLAPPQGHKYSNKLIKAFLAALDPNNQPPFVSPNCPQVSDDQLKKASHTFPHNPPLTKEAYYFRQIFEKLFPGQAKWIPYYWMPKWLNATDPSARTLHFYEPEKVE